MGFQAVGLGFVFRGLSLPFAIAVRASDEKVSYLTGVTYSGIPLGMEV